MIELTARRLGLTGDIANDYAAFYDGAAMLDLSDRGRMRFLGAGARSALNGVMTSDLATLVAGSGAYGVALTNKGKIVADVTVFASADSFLVDCSVPAWPGWQQLVSKYINPRLATRNDVTESTGSLGIFGPEAQRITAALSGIDSVALDGLAMYSHLDCVARGHAVNVARIPDMGVVGYRLLTKRESLDSLREVAAAEGARAIGAPAAECARIEAGRPLFGLDMDENTLAQEANLEVLGAISYTKGCYTGQETVARLHFRGHVNKRLMGLRIEGSAAPARGAELTSVEGTACGDVRSSIVSPRFGAIALAMVRREVGAGGQVMVRVGESEARAEVTALPFGG